MNPRERLAWLLVVALTVTATTLWWRGRDRYEFRASSNGAIVWKLDRQRGEAWLAGLGDQTWKPIVEASTFTFEEAQIGATNATTLAEAFGRGLERSANQGWDFLLAQVRGQFPAYTNRTDDELIVGFASNYPGILRANPALRGPLNEVQARLPAAGAKAPPINPTKQ